MKKHPKQDPKQVAAKQRHEVSYISGRYNIPAAAVREAIKKVGKSRRKIYAELRLQGFVIDTKTRNKK